MFHQCLITPATMKKHVKKFTRATIVLNNATKSASFELSDAFSPRDIHQSFHIFRINNLYKKLSAIKDDNLWYLILTLVKDKNHFFVFWYKVDLRCGIFIKLEV